MRARWRSILLLCSIWWLEGGWMWDLWQQRQHESWDFTGTKVEVFFINQYFTMRRQPTRKNWLIDWLIDALVWLPLFLPNFGHETVGFRYTFRYVNWYCRPGAMDSRTRHLTTPRMLDHPWPTRPITGKIITCWNDSGSWSWWPSCLHRKYLDLRRANQHGNQLFFFGPLAWPQSKYALHQCDWAW